jgi:hypothetical protein
MSDWQPVVDLVEKLTALAMQWDNYPDRQVCAGDLRAVLANQYDPRDPDRPPLGPDDQGDCKACNHLVVSHRDEGCNAELRTSTGLRPCPCLLARWQVSGGNAWPPPTSPRTAPTWLC